MLEVLYLKGHVPHRVRVHAAGSWHHAYLNAVAVKARVMMVSVEYRLALKHR
jgi:hypothetical protein